MPFLISSIMFVSVYFLKYLPIPTPAILVLQILVGVIVYVALLFIFHRKDIKDIKNIFFKKKEAQDQQEQPQQNEGEEKMENIKLEHGSLSITDSNMNEEQTLNTKKQDRRNCSIDILRIISMFLIVFLHICSHGGLNQFNTIDSTNGIILRLLNSFAVVAVNVIALPLSSR